MKSAKNVPPLFMSTTASSTTIQGNKKQSANASTFSKDHNYLLDRKVIEFHMEMHQQNCLKRLFFQFVYVSSFYDFKLAGFVFRN